MLGCQDFCGYYDWTFNYIRCTYGPQALSRYWAEAIAGDAQRHYAALAREHGLRGLLQAWDHTGEQEHCDWTFQLDEACNILRWDMRQCPSKGYLLAHGLSACEDYCDHCMGWIIPLLAGVGAEVVAHEHNHCGQCWGEIRMTARPCQPLQPNADIREDPRWNRGHIDAWRAGRKLPDRGSAAGDQGPE